LSIIGLNNGEQPMTSPDGAVHLVVNGEFYGYREIGARLRAGGYKFSTESDSEIALHLYDERGMQCAAELRGEFAVIIADERQQAMIAIRDRFGIKPLYYSIVNGEVFFASEIKALLAMGVPAVWDLEGATGGIGRSHEKTEFACLPAVTRSPGTATFASIRIGIGKSPRPRKCDATRAVKPRSLPISARLCSIPFDRD
jgi:asparagine synthase (glutamine-hydrolysing)